MSAAALLAHLRRTNPGGMAHAMDMGGILPQSRSEPDPESEGYGDMSLMERTAHFQTGGRKKFYQEAISREAAKKEKQTQKQHPHQ